MTYACTSDKLIYFNSTCTFECYILSLNQSTQSVFINISEKCYKHCIETGPESVGNVNLFLFIPEGAANTEEHPAQAAFLIHF